MRQTQLIAVSLAALLGAAARADTVEVSSTTLVTAGQQTRGSGTNKPDLATVVPAYEILSVTARDVSNPFAKDLQFVLSGWGSYDLDSRRWDNGTGSNLTGDLLTGYVQGKLLDRHLTLRVGRTQIQSGTGRMLHLDGGEAVAFLPLGLRLSAYVGAPVSQRFRSRSGPVSWNPMGGDLAYGGRLSVSIPLAGIAGRGLDLGVSANLVDDTGKDLKVRREVGADLRFEPVAALTVTGFGAYSLVDERFSEAQVMGIWTPVKKWHVTADWRFIAPDLLLSRDSILSVFSASTRNQFGAGVSHDLGKGLAVGGDYHLQIEPGAIPGTDTFNGHEAAARLDWSRASTIAGVEAFYLDAYENGYVGGRVYGRQGFGKLFAAVDLLGHRFREKVNGEDIALTGSLSAGVELFRGFSAVLSGRAGVTPYLEQTFDVMAKLVYNQTYVRTEVR